MEIGELRNWQYSAEERLGGGNYAQVFRCHSAEMAGDYAIKVIDNPRYVRTFRREVQALQTMDGCAATPVLVDFGRNHEGKLALVTNWIPGVRLDQYLSAQGPLSADATYRLAEQMLTVLGYAHGRGLLHRDVSSFNLLMAEGGSCTLIDWGMAQPVGEGKAEVAMPKQEFVAPECYYGTHSVATDFYSLGWLLYQALTGALPYHFQEIAAKDYRVVAHCLERPVLPVAIPSPVRQLIANWLQKDPAQRMVGYDLSSLLQGVAGYEPDFSPYLTIQQIQRECGYLHRAARHGVPYAQYQLALRLFKMERRIEAHYWLQEAEDKGYEPAKLHRQQLLANPSEKDNG